MITSSSKPILKDPKFENKDYFILDEAFNKFIKLIVVDFTHNK